MKPRADGGVIFESTAEVDVAMAGLQTMEAMAILTQMPVMLSGVRALIQRMQDEPGAKKPSWERSAQKFLRTARAVIVTVEGCELGAYAEQAVEVVATAPERLEDFPTLIDPMRGEAAGIILENYLAAKAAGNFSTRTRT